MRTVFVSGLGREVSALGSVALRLDPVFPKLKGFGRSIMRSSAALAGMTSHLPMAMARQKESWENS